MARSNDPIEHLEFALRHEAFDLGVLVSALKAIDPHGIEDWVRRTPNSTFARRAWFYYETFVGKQLDLESATNLNYVDALDPARFIVGPATYAVRQRVRDNLLGTPGFCPTVRRTPRLDARIAERWDERVREFAEAHDPALFARAVNYLYTKESKSSYQIEGESPSPDRLERFVQILRRAGTFNTTSQQALLGLQAAILDARFVERDWRPGQIYVGEPVGLNAERVHFVGPRPEDLPTLMEGWAAMSERLLNSSVDAVVSSAISSFGFVFLHPLPDGNGRTHRFLIHNILARRGFTADGMLFPVSAAMVRNPAGYDSALDAFSSRLLSCVKWHFEPDGTFQPDDIDPDLYRYFDATPQAEYLYDQVARTTEEDLREQLEFLEVFTAAFSSAQAIVDMPDQQLSLFVRLCMQNGGRLSGAKRDRFAKLTDDEIARMEAGVQEAMNTVRERKPASR